MSTIVKRERPEEEHAVQQAEGRAVVEAEEASGRRISSYYEESHHFLGPLPPPDDIRKYNEVIPNGADRLMKLVELTTEGRVKNEAYEVRSKARLNTRGQYFAFILGITLIISGTIVALYAHPWAGSVIITGTLVAMIVAFLRGRSDSRDDAEPEEDESIDPSNQNQE